jgi:beta-aspartyl-peptidase (threonine type)
MTTPAIIVHGGARPIAPEKAQANRDGCLRAAAAGWAILQEGGSAADAVEVAIRVLESDPTFNAGYGATLNPDGVARLDAGMMEGGELRAGAIACVTGVRHPISVARRLMDRAEVLIVGEYAERLARTVPEAECCAPEELIAEEPLRKWREQQDSRRGTGRVGCDTVGCAARDVGGGFAAGASTGGIGNMLPGRVGDTPQVGAGFYADNALGAAAMTGYGEEILRVNLAYRVVESLRGPGDGADAAVGSALRYMRGRTGGVGGCILIDASGRVGWNHSDENIAVAYQLEGLTAPVAFVHKNEEKEGASIT